MSRICDVCSKSALKGNLVKRGIGRRVTRRTITRQEPNLFEKKILIEGRNIKVKICASCLKRLRKEIKDIEVAAKAEVTA